MTQAAPQITGGTATRDALRDWQAVRGSADIQYAPLPPIKPPVPPQWLVDLQKFLRDVFEPLGRWLGLSWPVLQWVLIGLAALMLAFLIWRLIQPLLARKVKRAVADEAAWTPDRAAAAALLEDADRLADEGRYGEAAHLLLQRSVHHIADARPDWLNPASTAREIAMLQSLPERARNAFTEIAVRVERSIFALRDLDAADWQAARDAYADFALAELRG